MMKGDKWGSDRPRPKVEFENKQLFDSSGSPILAPPTKREYSGKQVLDTPVQPQQGPSPCGEVSLGNHGVCVLRADEPKTLEEIDFHLAAAQIELHRIEQLRADFLAAQAELKQRDYVTARVAIKEAARLFTDKYEKDDKYAIRDLLEDLVRDMTPGDMTPKGRR